MERTQWVIAYASVMGALHVRENIPCQDSCACKSFSNGWGIAVVADGAGSCTHSHIGSAKVTELAVKVFSALMGEKKWDRLGRLPSEDEWRGLAYSAVVGIRQGLEKFAKEKNLALLSLSSTLIAVIYSPIGLLVTHIGDGRAGYFNGKEWQSILQPFNGETASETIFLTSDVWIGDEKGIYIESRVIADRVEAFTLLSDGCEKGAFEVNMYDEVRERYYDPNKPFANFFNPNLKGLLSLHKEKKSQADINKLWESFLTAGTIRFKHEPDDKTMVLGVLVP